MRNLGATVLATCGVALLAAGCGHREQSVVDQYFRAVNAEDNQTLSSFAVVNMADKVDSWKIVSAAEEVRQPASLPGLNAKVDAVQAQLDENKKAYNAYFLDHPQEVDEVRELLKGEADIPSKLQQYADEWTLFVDKEKELKKAHGDAKDAVARERKNVTLSVGTEAVDKVTEVVEKRFELSLTIKGEAKNYGMTLRRYDTPADTVPRVLSRWVIFELQPS